MALTFVVDPAYTAWCVTVIVHLITPHCFIFANRLFRLRSSRCFPIQHFGLHCASRRVWIPVISVSGVVAMMAGIPRWCSVEILSLVGWPMFRSRPGYCHAPGRHCFRGNHRAQFPEEFGADSLSDSWFSTPPGITRSPGLSCQSRVGIWVASFPVGQGEERGSYNAAFTWDARVRTSSCDGAGGLAGVLIYLAKRLRLVDLFELRKTYVTGIASLAHPTDLWSVLHFETA